MIKPTKLFFFRQSIELGHPQHPLVKRYTWFLSATKKKRKSTSVGEKNKPQNAKAHFLWILMIWRMVQLYEVNIREQRGRLVKPPTNLTKIVIVTSSLFPLCSALLFIQGVPLVKVQKLYIGFWYRPFLTSLWSILNEFEGQLIFWKTCNKYSVVWFF